MTKKATLKTFAGGGHLGDADSQEEKQPDMAPLLPAGVNAEEAEEIETNKDEEEDNGALPIPGTIEKG